MPSGKPTQLPALPTAVMASGGISDDREPEYIRREAKAFLETMWTELNIASAEIEQRCWDVDAEIARTGTYRHTVDELEFGSRLAWRNHTRCIGKLYWRTLTVRDCRTATSGPAIRDALVEHLRLAGNGGRIKPMLTLFAPQTPGRRVPIVLNDQLLKYAGYAQPDGSVVGDPASVALTAEAQRLG